MQDRPTAPELVAAVRQFLNDEIVPGLVDPRLRFRALVAANVLSIVERELLGDEAVLREEYRRLAALERPGDDPTELPDTVTTLRAAIDARARDLCARIRAGEAESGPWRQDVLAYTRWSVREKLRIANPRYLARVEGEAGTR